MVNKLDKGRRLEREFERFLNKLGYLTYRPIHTKFNRKDIFNFADILAVADLSILKNTHVVFIQVKSNMVDFYKAKKKARELAERTGIDCWVVTRKVKEEGKKVVRVWKVYSTKEGDYELY